MRTDLLWDEPVPPRRGPRPAFTLADIGRAGIVIADAEGLPALTMQRVAEALGVTKMALYRYVPGKDELVALMTDLAMGLPPATAGTEDWRAALRAWSHALFTLFQAHPWTITATVGARATGPNEVAWLERAVAALTGTGLTGPEMLDTAVLLTGHVRSLAQQTTRQPSPQAGRQAGVSATEQDLTVALFAQVSAHADRYPALAALMSAGRGESGDAGRNNALDYGLDRILDGLAVLIDTRTANGTRTAHHTGTAHAGDRTKPA
ncbi:TetR/AcrR family transcriptional regulator [Catenuloplanes japonicus]|uniref:TetR/AcrR family transcriptional regulator n=1 Tax=Catenuloplanes japonicus TaxID=33876 RepID=UPI00068ADF2F|nr:TetR/AcrR family transcriptional regulator [Catenuloplanes japonicus]